MGDSMGIVSIVCNGMGVYPFLIMSNASSSSLSQRESQPFPKTEKFFSEL
jgi:hypothetical protein